MNNISGYSDSCLPFPPLFNLALTYKLKDSLNTICSQKEGINSTFTKVDNK